MDTIKIPVPKESTKIPYEITYSDMATITIAISELVKHVTPEQKKLLEEKKPIKDMNDTLIISIARLHILYSILMDKAKETNQVDFKDFDGTKFI